MNIKEILILEYLKNIDLKDPNISLKKLKSELTPLIKESPSIEPVWADVKILNEDKSVKQVNETLKSITIWYTEIIDNKQVPKKVDIII